MPNEIGIPCPKCRLRNLELVILESSLPSRIVKIFKKEIEQCYFCEKCEYAITTEEYWLKVLVR